MSMAAVKDVQATHPRDELYAVYSRYYQVYTGLYPDLAARYAQLWNVEQQGRTSPQNRETHNVSIC